MTLPRRSCFQYASSLIIAALMSMLTVGYSLAQSTLTDSIVARFNKDDFKGIYALGSEEFKKNENEEGYLRFLASLKQQTGKIIAVSPLGTCGHIHAFKWQGEKKNLRAKFLMPSSTTYDDYFINNLIEQPTASLKRPSDNPLKHSVDRVVDKYVRFYLADANAVGLSIGILKNGKTYTYNYGETKTGTHQLPTTNSIYELGSIAKTFIATLLAQAVVDKKAALTDDIRKYLPGSYPNLVYQGQPIRLVHLTNHTSGLPESFRNFPYDSLNKLNEEEQFRYFEAYSTDNLFKDLHSAKLTSVPGQQYQYNGNAFHVLIAILERIYQRSYESLLTAYLQRQLGMSSTKNDLSASESKRFVQGYDNERHERLHFNNPQTMTGGPGLNSTLHDLILYIQANLAQTNGALKLTHQLTWGQPDGFGIGMAWMMNTKCSGDRYIYHSGRSRGCNSLCSFYPAKNMGVVILVNETVNQGRLFVLEDLLSQALAVEQ